VAVSISLYNHTVRRFVEGSNVPSDTYKVALYSSATFNAADTTLAGITKTEIAQQYGYTTGGAVLTNVSVSTEFDDGAIFEADSVEWTADGGSIVASYAILYNDTDPDDPPLAFIDFGVTASVTDGAEFSIEWDQDGIIAWFRLSV
jgi:hypothetical protein